MILVLYHSLSSFLLLVQQRYLQQKSIYILYHSGAFSVNSSLFEVFCAMCAHNKLIGDGYSQTLHEPGLSRLYLISSMIIRVLT